MTATKKKTSKRTPRTPANDYREFLRALKRGGWTEDQVAQETAVPLALQQLIDQLGQGHYEEWVIRALDADDLAGLPQVEPTAVPSPARNGKPKPSDEPKRAGNANDPVPTLDPKPRKDVQRLLNDLVFTRAGVNLLHRADRKELLDSVGLDERQITQGMMGIAEQAMRERLEVNRQQERLVWELPPAEEEIASTPAHVWRTVCRTYRIARFEGGPEPRFTAVTLTGEGTARERVIANDLQSLSSALDAVEKYHAQFWELLAVKGNRTAVLEHAEQNGLHKRPHLTANVQTQYDNSSAGVGPGVEATEAPEAPDAAPDAERVQTSEGRHVVQVTETVAREVLEQCGLPKTAKAGRDAVLKALNNPAKLAKKEPSDPKLRSVWDLVIKANEAGEGVELKAGGNGKAKKVSKTKVASNGKAGESRPGVCQAIEECLTKASASKPATKEGILSVLVKQFPDRDHSSMKNSVGTHVAHLVSGRYKKKGRLAKKNESGYWMIK